MAWTGLTLTVDGRNALNQAQAANQMNIKSIVVGDGSPPSNFRTMKGLVHQLFELTDLKLDIVDGKCVLTVDFPKVDYDYYFREIGVVATTEDGDVLYVYDNCGDDAQYVVTSTGVEETQKRLRISLLISDVADITVTSPSLLYVGFDEFEAEVENLRQAEEDIAALQERTGALETGKADEYGYLVCETAGNVAAKVVDCEGFVLKKGVKIVVMFVNNNTAQNITLNVGGTGAKSIYYSNLPVHHYGIMPANRLYGLVYDGTFWRLIGEFTSPNSAQTNGYVPAGIEHKGMVYTTDANGNPGWRLTTYNGMSIDGTVNRTNYGICSTASNTVEKTVACEGFALVTGAEITVKFTNGNAAASPTLNVNDTGAKPIYYNGSSIAALNIGTKNTLTFRYNGAQWDYVGTIDRDTWKANTKTSDGYVAKGTGNPNKVWGTDANGNPGWKEFSDADIVKLTRAEYDALPDTKLTDGKIYFISDGGGSVAEVIQAGDVLYSNTTSGLTATTVQNAIDELAQEKLDKSGGIASGEIQMGDGTTDTCPNVRWRTNKLNVFAGTGLDDVGNWHIYDDVNSRDIIYYNSTNGQGVSRGGNHIEMRTDGEGGNLTLTGPGALQNWEMDNWNNENLRIYCSQGGTIFTPLRLSIYGAFAALSGATLDDPWYGDTAQFTVRMGYDDPYYWIAFRFQISPVPIGFQLALKNVGSSSPLLQVRYLYSGWGAWKTITNLP